MTYYQTKEGDMLDAICYAHYGASIGYVETVLLANPGLANQAPLLPASISIVLPELPMLAAKQQTVRLWN
jgi:phage tail protein X